MNGTGIVEKTGELLQGDIAVLITPEVSVRFALLYPGGVRPLLRAKLEKMG
jgi:hypothetical protein